MNKDETTTAFLMAALIALLCVLGVWLVRTNQQYTNRIGSIICYTGEGKEYYRNSYASISEGNGMFYIDNTTSISGNCVVIYKQGK